MIFKTCRVSSLLQHLNDDRNANTSFANRMSSAYLKTTSESVLVSRFAVHATLILKSKFALRMILLFFRRRAAAIGVVACAYSADMPVSTSVTRCPCIKRWYVWNAVRGRRKAVLIHARRHVESPATSNARIPCLVLLYLVDISQINSNAIKPRILKTSYARLW